MLQLQAATSCLDNDHDWVAYVSAINPYLLKGARLQPHALGSLPDHCLSMHLCLVLCRKVLLSTHGCIHNIESYAFLAAALLRC